MKVRVYKPFREQKDKKKVIRQVFAYLYVLSTVPYLILFFKRIKNLMLISAKKKYKHEVSLCMIFKNEAHYLYEWLVYHQLIGVDHIYLYNNNSDDRYLEIVTPFINAGFVTLRQWPKDFAQREAYEDCYERTKNETHWLGFIDADEFVNLQSYDNVSTFLNNYKNYPSVLLNWKMFGTSGRLYKNSEFVIESFTSCWPYLSNVGKSFINNDFTNFKIDIHYCISTLFYFPIFPVSTSKIFTPFMISVFSSIFPNGNLAYINHYWSKDYEHYLYKDNIKGDAMDSQNIQTRRRKGRFEYHELQNYDRDYSIQRWLIFMKLFQNNQ